MTKPESLRRNILILFFYPLCFLPLEQQQKCYPEDICALTFISRMDPSWFIVGHVSVAFPQPLKSPNCIRNCCPVFSQGMSVPSVRESYGGEQHRKLPGEASDMPKSILIFPVITFRCGVCACSENSHLLSPSS